MPGRSDPALQAVPTSSHDAGGPVCADVHFAYPLDSVTVWAIECSAECGWRSPLESSSWRSSSL